MVCLSGMWEGCQVSEPGLLVGCQVSEWFVCQACGNVVKYMSGLFARPVGMLSSI